MKNKLIIGFVVIAVLFGALFLLTRGNYKSQESQTNQTGLEVGMTPPSFIVKTIDGKELSLENLKGKPVILQSYAFWCPSCLLESANLSEAALPYKDKITIVSFTFDPQETKEATEEFKRTTKGFGGEGAFWDFVLLAQGDNVVFNYKMAGPDHTYIIGKDGQIVYKDRGITSTETFSREIQKVI